MNKKKATAVTVGILVALMIGNLGGVKSFIEGAGEKTNQKSVAAIAASPDNSEALKEQIRLEADKLRIEPVNARVDRVWKAIPGYNGQEVDLEATYRNIDVHSFDPAKNKIPFVFREIKPKVTLDDLGAQPIYRGNPKKPMAALMINVAWGNEYLESILTTLDQEKVKATFFLDGSWLSKNEEWAKEIQRRGHQLENHAYSHPNMSRLSRQRATLEIQKTKQLLKDKLGVENSWFAPPSGDFNQQTVELAAAQGLKTVLWTVDTVDWRNPAPEAVIEKMSKQIEAGSLILMHPTATTKASLKGIIDVIKSKGLKAGTVGETLSESRMDQTQP